MAPTQPSQSTWTIRFRHHKTTVLLPIDPSQSIASIKSDLLAALQQTTPTGRLSNATPLPDSTDDILLAKPVDINDAAAGWTSLVAPESNGTLAKNRPLAKAKGKGKAGNAAEGVDAESLKSLGIKDNALLAFKFASHAAMNGRMEGEEDEDDDEDMDGVDGEERREKWDVVMPAWEDQYGVTNTGDVGALPDFNG